MASCRRAALEKCSRHDVARAQAPAPEDAALERALGARPIIRRCPAIFPAGPSCPASCCSMPWKRCSPTTAIACAAMQVKFIAPVARSAADRARLDLRWPARALFDPLRRSDGRHRRPSRLQPRRGQRVIVRPLWIDQAERAAAVFADATDGVPGAAARARGGACAALSICAYFLVFSRRARLASITICRGCWAPSGVRDVFRHICAARRYSTDVPDGEAHRVFRLPGPRCGRAARRCCQARSAVCSSAHIWGVSRCCASWRPQAARCPCRF